METRDKVITPLARCFLLYKYGALILKKGNICPSPFYPFSVFKEPFYPTYMLGEDMDECYNYVGLTRLCNTKNWANFIIAIQKIDRLRLSLHFSIEVNEISQARFPSHGLEGKNISRVTLKHP